MSFSKIYFEKIAAFQFKNDYELLYALDFSRKFFLLFLRFSFILSLILRIHALQFCCILINALQNEYDVYIEIQQ